MLVAANTTLLLQIHLEVASPTEMWVIWVTGIPCIRNSSYSGACPDMSTPVVVNYGTSSGAYPNSVPGCALAAEVTVAESASQFCMGRMPIMTSSR